LHGPGLHLQRRIRVLADLRERDPSSRFALGIELLVLDLPLDVLVGVRHAVGRLPTVDPREAREIMSQGAIRPETARDRRERRVLADDLTGSPAKSQLPMDPRTRDFVKVNGRSYEREPLDERWILSRFPADVSAATAA